MLIDNKYVVKKMRSVKLCDISHRITPIEEKMIQSKNYHRHNLLL